MCAFLHREKGLSKEASFLSADAFLYDLMEACLEIV